MPISPVAAQVQDVIDAAALLHLELSACRDGDPAEVLRDRLVAVADAVVTVLDVVDLEPSASLDLHEQVLTGTRLDQVLELERLTSLPAVDELPARTVLDVEALDGLERLDDTTYEVLDVVVRALEDSPTTVSRAVRGYQVDLTRIVRDVVEEVSEVCEPGAVRPAYADRPEHAAPHDEDGESPLRRAAHGRRPR